MTMIKTTHLLLAVTVSLYGLMTLKSCNSAKQSQEIHVIAENMSPDKQVVATTYMVSGGGAAGYAYRLVNLRHANEAFSSESTIVFQMTGSGEIDLIWDDEAHLTIKYPKLANI